MLFDSCGVIWFSCRLHSADELFEIESRLFDAVTVAVASVRANVLAVMTPLDAAATQIRMFQGVDEYGTFAANDTFDRKRVATEAALLQPVLEIRYVGCRAGHAANMPR